MIGNVVNQQFHTLSIQLREEIYFKRITGKLFGTRYQ